MYYKITNKESKVYKELFKLRMGEIRMEDENLIAIKQKIKLEYGKIYGDLSQQNWHRVKRYAGFEFIRSEEVDLKIWSKLKENEIIYIPNKRTKVGREMQDFLLRGLQSSSLGKVFDILNINHDQGRFTIPYVEIFENIIILYLGSKQEPTLRDVLEITKKEFYLIHDRVYFRK